jgi:acetyltransferase-like isoleucine patch superfamily enzyme
MAAPAIQPQWHVMPQRIRTLARVLPAAIHEQALCESADVGDGSVVGAYAYVTDGAVIGAECRIGASAQIEGLLGDGVIVERGALVARGVRVGDHAIVRDGSFVLSDVPARAIVSGNPARIIA